MKIQSVVVLGGNVAGLLVALTLKRRVPQLAVQVVRGADDDLLSVSEATTASFPKLLFDHLQLKPAQFYREVEPLWKLGTRFLWGRRPEFYHTFAREYENPPAEFPRGIGFYYTDEVRAVGPASMLMAHGKAFIRRSDGLPQLSRNFGFHVESTKLRRYLENRCREDGITILDDRLCEVERNSEGIASLHLESGQQTTADLFIDSSSSGAESLNRPSAEPFVSYERTLLCDRVLTGGWTRTDEVARPCTTVETMDAGWCWQIEHEHWISRGYVYSSRFLSDEEAIAEFLQKNPKITPDTLKTHSFQQGRYLRSWVDNVVSVGDASGYLEPLQNTRLHLVCTQARMLADLITDSLQAPTPSLIELYNEAIADEWDDICEFLSIHYAFNTRLDTPFWRACWNETDQGSAARIVRYYQENGPILTGAPMLTRPTNPFGLDGYLTLLTGQGVPHSKSCRPSASEQHMWRKRLALLEAQALRALTVTESLQALRDANWPGM